MNALLYVHVQEDIITLTEQFTVIGSLWLVHCDWFIVIGSLWLVHCDWFIVIGSLWLVHCDWFIVIGYSLMCMHIRLYNQSQWTTLCYMYM